MTCLQFYHNKSNRYDYLLGTLRHRVHTPRMVLWLLMDHVAGRWIRSHVASRNVIFLFPISIFLVLGGLMTFSSPTSKIWAEQPRARARRASCEKPWPSLQPLPAKLLEYGPYQGFLAGLCFRVLLFSGRGRSFSEEDEGPENRAPGFQQADGAADQPGRLWEGFGVCHLGGQTQHGHR